MTSSLSFNERVWRLTAQIPHGRVSTYGLIAKALGQPRAARAVGNALNKNPHAFTRNTAQSAVGGPRVPCHRVVRSSGQVGGYADGTPAKARILRQEGIRIGPKNKVVDFAKVLYTGFSKVK